MSSLGNGHQDVDIDLAQLFRAVWSRKGRILAATALTGALAFVGASLMDPTYEADARILIEPRQPTFLSPGSASTTSEPLSDELNIVSQVQLLQSVDLMKQVARDLKLYEREEFDPDTRPSAISDFLVLFGLKKNPLELPPEQRVLRAFKEKLQVYQVEKSRVIGIEFTSKDPALAAAVPNAIIDVYRQLQSGAKLDSNSDAARWLETEIANLREKVRDAEQKVAEYRSSAGLMPLGTDSSSFSSKQLSDISSELARVRGERADAEAKAQNVLAALKSGRPTDTLDTIAGSESVQRLKTTESQIRGQIADLSTTLLDGHPQMKALRAQLSGIREQIAAESSKIAASLENDAAVARERETQLIAQLNTVKADSARAGEDEVGLMALEREATAQRQLLETYLARYREASTRLGKDASPADARVVSSAIEPSEQNFPKVIPITIVAAMATLILSAVLVMMLELFSGRALRPSGSQVDNRERDDESEPQMVGPQTVLSPIPADTSESQIETLADDDLAYEMEQTLDFQPESPDRDEPEYAEEPGAPDDEDEFSVSAVATYLMEEQTRIAFAISPSGDDGSAGTVLLARELSSRGVRVVLIDMTGSACPTLLMASDADLPGVTDLLCGDAAFADTIHPDRLSGADIIPQGNSDIRQAMRGADRLSMIVDALADAYDMVVVECGPANADGVARLSRSGTHEIILSAPEPNPEELAEIMAAFESAGYSDLVLMAASLPVPDDRDRNAA